MDLTHDINECARASPLPGCSGIIFSTMRLPYSHIYGIVNGRYFGTVEGFSGSYRSSNTSVNDN